jgi:hypothetical protein
MLTLAVAAATPGWRREHAAPKDREQPLLSLGRGTLAALLVRLSEQHQRVCPETRYGLRRRQRGAIAAGFKALETSPLARNHSSIPGSSDVA